jgi:hypothetical protein
MKKILLIAIVLLSSIALFGCKNGAELKTEEQGNKEQQQIEKNEEQSTSADYEENDLIVYQNTQYGFDFSLPNTWEGYSIVASAWEGVSLKEQESGKVIETGPIISIRHPQWTSENPRQDIPIMVFTLKQWESMQNDEFHIGAAPMNPSELGRNSKYVFALPARYNYAFPTGYEEVEDILKNNSLQPTENN